MDLEGKTFHKLTFNKAHCYLKYIPGDYLMKLVDRVLRVCKAVIKAIKNLKYKIYFDLFNTFWVT